MRVITALFYVAGSTLAVPMVDIDYWKHKPLTHYDMQHPEPGHLENQYLDEKIESWAENDPEEEGSPFHQRVAYYLSQLDKQFSQWDQEEQEREMPWWIWKMQDEEEEESELTMTNKMYAELREAEAAAMRSSAWDKCDEERTRPYEDGFGEGYDESHGYYGEGFRYGPELIERAVPEPEALMSPEHVEPLEVTLEDESVTDGGEEDTIVGMDPFLYFPSQTDEAGKTKNPFFLVVNAEGAVLYEIAGEDSSHDHNPALAPEVDAGTPREPKLAAAIEFFLECVEDPGTGSCFDAFDRLVLPGFMVEPIDDNNNTNNTGPSPPDPSPSNQTTHRLHKRARSLHANSSGRISDRHWRRRIWRGAKQPWSDRSSTRFLYLDGGIDHSRVKRGLRGGAQFMDVLRGRAWPGERTPKAPKNPGVPPQMYYKGLWKARIFGTPKHTLLQPVVPGTAKGHRAFHKLNREYPIWFDKNKAWGPKGKEMVGQAKSLDPMKHWGFNKYGFIKVYFSMDKEGNRYPKPSMQYRRFFEYPDKGKMYTHKPGGRWSDLSSWQPHITEVTPWEHLWKDYERRIAGMPQLSKFVGTGHEDLGEAKGSKPKKARKRPEDDPKNAPVFERSKSDVRRLIAG